MKLTTEELRRIPSHYCKDCDTVFGYDHDTVIIEDDGNELLPHCPCNHLHKNVVEVCEMDDHMHAVWTYIGQLETKDDRRGHGLNFTPYPFDGDC